MQYQTTNQKTLFEKGINNLAFCDETVISERAASRSSCNMAFSFLSLLISLSLFASGRLSTSPGKKSGELSISDGGSRVSGGCGGFLGKLAIMVSD